MKSRISIICEPILYGHMLVLWFYSSEMFSLSSDAVSVKRKEMFLDVERFWKSFKRMDAYFRICWLYFSQQ